MTSPLRTFLATVGLGLALAVPAAAQTIYGDAARVNGVAISKFRLERFFDDYVKNKGRNIGRMIQPRIYKKLKREALDLLIEHEVLWQASQKAGVKIADAEIDALIGNAIAQSKSREDFLRKLEVAGFTEPEYRDYVRRELAGARYLREAVAEAATVDEADIRTVYEQNPDKFLQPETVAARHILIQSRRGESPAARDEARRRIAAIQQRLKKGEDFADLARRYSEDPSAPNGGDLGEFTRGRMVPEFEAAAFSLPAGQVSGVIETQFGFHLLKVDAHRAEKTLTLDEAREPIRNQLLAERRSERARQLTAELIAAAKVEILVYLESE